MKVDKVQLPQKPVQAVVDNSRGASKPEVSEPVTPPTAPVLPLKKGLTPVVDTKPGEENLSPRQIEAKRKAEKEAKENPVTADAPEYIPNTEEGFVTLTAADPKMKLEVSIGDQFWAGHSIQVPKQFEGDVRRLLEGAGMYVKN